MWQRWWWWRTGNHSKRISLCVWHLLKHLQWKIGFKNISRQITWSSVSLSFPFGHRSWVVTAREAESISFCAANKIISPFFQKSTDDKSPPKHGRQGKVSLHTGFYLLLLLLLLILLLLLLLLHPLSRKWWTKLMHYKHANQPVMNAPWKMSFKISKNTLLLRKKN